ncbi:bifunctional adenosylcobinamide kinase/adenosylcobinamide-phosphate guanylyltransferase [Rhizobiaceae bacterium]|nr:bifunctional adenosylcobinamide kinase/adenosylcobinamide-phosphate guanylyltransferase [Rhizobiaceae bacterium]
MTPVDGACLILGGARSGKSAFAEAMCKASGRRMIYLATGRSFDGEMDDRIAQHRTRRGPDWTLVEEPVELTGALASNSAPDTVVLVDCLTLWLTNLMLADRAVDMEADAMVEALDPAVSIIFVSNEVGQGIVPDNAMARAFRDHAGRLHQRLAAKIPNVWFVTAGLPQKLK